MTTMQTETSQINTILTKNYSLTETSGKPPLSEIFSENRSGNINEYMLYLTHINSVPNFLCEIEIDCKKARAWFENNFNNEIKQHYYNKRYFSNNKQAIVDDAFYFMYEDLMVNFDYNNSKVRFLFNQTTEDSFQDILQGIRKFKHKKSRFQPRIGFLISSFNGFDLKYISMSRQKLDITNNYNDDFLEVHQTILKRLRNKKDKGLVLLHGKPGTGKTSYIKYLSSIVKKNFIFLPPNLASVVTNPEMISILMDCPNSIFVIEDAEHIVIDRNQEGNSPVATLLNITDGFLSECLNLQIICTFNTDISKIDSALLRKGRLIAKYEFKELSVAKVNALSQKIGKQINIQTPMVLSSIYNCDDSDFSKPKTTSIGFRTKTA